MPLHLLALVIASRKNTCAANKSGIPANCEVELITEEASYFGNINIFYMEKVILICTESKCLKHCYLICYWNIFQNGTIKITEWWNRLRFSCCSPTHFHLKNSRNSCVSPSHHCCLQLFVSTSVEKWSWLIFLFLAVKCKIKTKLSTPPLKKIANTSFNPFTPRGNQYVTSPYHDTTLLSKLMMIIETVIDSRILNCYTTKFSILKYEKVYSTH